MIDYQATPTPPAKKTGGNPLMLIVSGVLVVALIVVGVLYGMEVGKLNKANQNITSLEANVTSLTGQLTAEKATVADLQTQLAAQKATVADLQTQLAATKSDLTASQAKVTSLTSDLSTANASVTSLTANLATANGKITTIQASLDKANADLAVANATINTQTTTLKKIQNPRCFNSLQELTDWLAKDDTNTKYASLDPVSRCYVLQSRALNDGFLLSASTRIDSTTHTAYLSNQAWIGGTLYGVNSATDQIFIFDSGYPPIPLYPIPQS